MSLSFYKPNPSNTGSAFSAQIGEDGKTGSPTLYFKAIKQFSWDKDKRVGNFSGNKDDASKNISVKFNENECGEIISAITHRYGFGTFHAFEDNKTSIKFTPWDKPLKAKGEEIGTVPAFGITIIRNGSDTFKMPMDPGECQVVVEYLKHFFIKLFAFRENAFKKAPF
jgi:hypothetical protein